MFKRKQRKIFKDNFTNRDLRQGYIVYSNYDGDRISSYHIVRRGKFLSSKSSDLGIKADVIVR